MVAAPFGFGSRAALAEEKNLCYIRKRGAFENGLQITHKDPLLPHK